MRRDDRHLAPCQLIDQRRLADIRRTCDRNHQPVAQTFALALRRKHFLNLAEKLSDLCQRGLVQFRGHIALVGKIDAGLDQCRGLDNLCAPVPCFVAEQTLHLAERLAALPIGVGMNQIVQRFGFGEIELAVFKRAAGEFARLGGPHIFKS